MLKLQCNIKQQGDNNKMKKTLAALLALLTLTAAILTACGE